MGYMERYNKHPQVQAERALQRILDMFPDRDTFEQWATAKGLSDEHRAHLESRLPARLQAQGTV